MKSVQIINYILMPIIIVICEKYANGYSVNINACSESVSEQQIVGNDAYTLQIDFTSVGASVILCHCYIWTDAHVLNNVAVNLQLNSRFYRPSGTCGYETYPCDFFKSTVCNMTACTDDIITDTEGPSTHSQTFQEVRLYEILLRYVRFDNEDLNEGNNVGSMSFIALPPVHLHIQCGPLDEIGNKPPRPDFNTQETQSTSSPNTDSRLHCEKSCSNSTAYVTVIVVLIIILLCLLLVGGLCYMYYYRSNENRTSHPDTGAMYPEPRLTSAEHKTTEGNPTSHVYANTEQLVIGDEGTGSHEVEDGYLAPRRVGDTIVPVVEEFSTTNQYEYIESC